MSESRPVYRWYHRVAGVLFALFCFEIGLFLIYLPWSPFWENNFLSGLAFVRPWWGSPFLRGAVSGLGIVNIFISFSEVARLRRFSGQ